MAKSPKARAVRVWLVEHDKTQEWLALKLGVDHSTLSRVLRGLRPASDELAKDLRRLTGVDISTTEAIEAVGER